MSHDMICLLLVTNPFIIEFHASWFVNFFRDKLLGDTVICGKLTLLMLDIFFNVRPGAYTKALIILFLNQNICCVYSKEPSQ